MVTEITLALLPFRWGRLLNSLGAEVTDWVPVVDGKVSFGPLGEFKGFMTLVLTDEDYIPMMTHELDHRLLSSLVNSEVSFTPRLEIT